MLSGRFAVCRVDPSDRFPSWATRGPLWSVTATESELAVLCDESRVPNGVRAERGFRCLAVEGPLDFSLTGVIARMARPLAQAGIPIFVVSTFETDLLFVRDERLAAAAQALREAGFSVRDDPDGQTG